RRLAREEPVRPEVHGHRAFDLRDRREGRGPGRVAEGERSGSRGRGARSGACRRRGRHSLSAAGTAGTPGTPGTRKVVVLGGGFAAYRFARELKGEKKLDVTLVSPRNHFLFTPLLPSTTVGTLEFRSILEPLRRQGSAG